MSNKRRKVVSDMLRNYELERIYTPEQQPIKSEPRDRTPPHHNISSPPLHSYAPQYEQNWNLENLQGLGVAGTSHAASGAIPFQQELWGNQPYAQVSPAHLQASPSHLQPSPGHLQAQNLQVLQPAMQALSPNMQPMSPNMQPLSPNMQAGYVGERMSPNMTVMSPNISAMSPNMTAMSPHAQSMSPGLQPGAAMGRISPNMPQTMGHISPNLQQQPTYAQQPQPNLMETDGHSTLSNLLLERGDSSLQLNSSELSGLSALLADRQHDPQPLDY